MTNRQTKTGAKVFRKTTVLLIAILAFIEVPENCYRLIEEVRVSLCNSMSPEDLEENWDNVRPLVADGVIMISHRQTDNFEIQDH